MTLNKHSFAEKAFLPKGEIFRGLGTKLSKTSIPGMRISQNLAFFLPLTVLNFCLLALSVLFFWAPLQWLPFSSYVLSGCREKLDVNYGRSLKMDLDQS